MSGGLSAANVEDETIAPNDRPKRKATPEEALEDMILS
jgi:hypothetical protein